MSTSYTVFKSRNGASFVMPSGKVLGFFQGIYETTDAGEIAALNAEIAAGNPYIYQDAFTTDVSNTNISNQQLLADQVVDVSAANIAG